MGEGGHKWEVVLKFDHSRFVEIARVPLWENIGAYTTCHSRSKQQPQISGKIPQSFADFLPIFFHFSSTSKSNISYLRLIIFVFLQVYRQPMPVDSLVLDEDAQTKTGSFRSAFSHSNTNNSKLLILFTSCTLLN